jgi:hypothetical protein
MKVEVKTEDERQELLRAITLADNFVLPGVADLSDIKKQLVKGKI